MENTKIESGYYWVRQRENWYVVKFDSDWPNFTWQAANGRFVGDVYWDEINETRIPTPDEPKHSTIKEFANSRSTEIFAHASSVATKPEDIAQVIYDQEMCRRFLMEGGIFGFQLAQQSTLPTNAKVDEMERSLRYLKAMIEQFAMSVSLPVPVLINDEIEKSIQSFKQLLK